LLQQEQPDLLLLQEVPVYDHGPFWELDGVRQALAEYHLEYVSMHRVRRQDVYYNFAHTGVATFSRREVVAASAIALPTVSRPKLGPVHQVQRIALHTTHTAGAIAIEVLNLHLENTTRPAGRTTQLRYLLDRLDQRASTVVLGGDFNTLFGSLEGVGRELRSHGFRIIELEGRMRLLPRLDFFCLRGSRQGWGRQLQVPGSDHRPVLFELAVTGDTPMP